MKSTINSPIGIEFTSLWANMMKKYGPSGWTNIQWYDGMNGFAAGKYGMFLDCDFFAQTYENPAVSQVAGKVGYAYMPKGPEGQHALSDTWMWSLAVNGSSRNKKEAWLFMEWATASQTMLTATLKYRNFNPTRKSVWINSDVVKMTSGWDNGNWRNVVDGNLSKYAKIRWTPEPEVSTMGTRWAQGLVDVYEGQNASVAMNNAANDINRLMARAGLTV
jgi:multiple sugar transport system substrate-binding protein